MISNSLSPFEAVKGNEIINIQVTSQPSLNQKSEPSFQIRTRTQQAPRQRKAPHQSNITLVQMERDTGLGFGLDHSYLHNPSLDKQVFRKQTKTFRKAKDCLLSHYGPLKQTERQDTQRLPRVSQRSKVKQTFNSTKREISQQSPKQMEVGENQILRKHEAHDKYRDIQRSRNTIYNKARTLGSLVPPPNPKQLCTEMLTDVLKVPECNRPQRTLIKQMIIQKSQVNNLFSEKNLSFKKQQRISEIVDQQRARQQYQKQFGDSTNDIMLASHYGGTGSKLMERTLNSSQLIMTHQDLKMWEMPNLLRNKSIEQQRGLMDEDDDISLIDVSKVDLKLKEKPLKVKYENMAARRKSRNDSHSQQNSNNHNSIIVMNRTYQDNDLLKHTVAPLEDQHSQEQIIVIRDDSKRELDHFPTMTTQLEVKISKPKSQNLIYRSRLRKGTVPLLDDTSCSLSNNQTPERVGTAMGIYGGQFKGLMINQDSEKNLNPNLNKVSIFMHLAKQNEDHDDDTLRSTMNLDKPDLTPRKQAMELEIQKAYQGVKYEAMKQMLMMNLFQSTLQSNGHDNSQRSILSRSSLLLQKQLNPQFQFEAAQQESPPPSLQKKKSLFYQQNLPKTFKLNADLKNDGSLEFSSKRQERQVANHIQRSPDKDDSIFKKRSYSTGLNGKGYQQQNLLNRKMTIANGNATLGLKLR